jgi:hypothetical protein
VLGTLHLLFCIGMIMLFLGGGLEHAIKLCEVVPGMTEAQVVEAWRDPDSTTEWTLETAEGGARERSVWIYEDRSRAVIFENGIVVRSERRK